MADQPVSHAALKAQFLDVYHGTLIQVPTRLTTHEMRGFLRRHFDLFSRNAFFLRRYALILGGDDAVEKLVPPVLAAMKDTEAQFMALREATVTLCREMGVEPISQQAVGEDPAAFVKIIDPLAMRYLQVIQLGDEVYGYVYALWLVTRFTEREFARARKEIRKALASLYGTTRTLSQGTRSRALREREPRIPSAIEVTAGVPADNSAAGVADAGDSASPETMTADAGVVKVASRRRTELPLESADTEGAAEPDAIPTEAEAA